MTISVVRPRIRLPRALRGWVLPLALLALWWAAVRFGWTASPLLVPVSSVWDTALRQVQSGALATALGASLWRDLAGFAIGASAGLVFGTALGLSRLFDAWWAPASIPSSRSRCLHGSR